MSHLENGYTKIANGILEDLARTQLSGRERRILDVVFRRTYGFGQKWAKISGSFFEEATGIDRQDCQRVEKRLRKRNILERRGRYVRFQKYSTKWDNGGENAADPDKSEPPTESNSEENRPNGGENAVNGETENPTAAKMPSKTAAKMPHNKETKKHSNKKSPTSKKSAKKSSQKSKSKKAPDPINFEIADLLFAGIRKSIPGKADLTTQRRRSWAEQIARFSRLDKVPHSEMKKVINWLFGPNLKRSTPFNVQSPDSLRRKWDNIVFSMKAYSTDDLEDRIEKQWRIVFDVSCRIGRSGSWGLKDPITRAVVQTMTPSRFCNMTKRDVAGVKAQFVDLYRREYERRGRE